MICISNPWCAGVFPGSCKYIRSVELVKSLKIEIHRHLPTSQYVHSTKFPKNTAHTRAYPVYCDNFTVYLNSKRTITIEVDDHKRSGRLSGPCGCTGAWFEFERHPCWAQNLLFAYVLGFLISVIQNLEPTCLGICNVCNVLAILPDFDVGAVVLPTCAPLRPHAILSINFAPSRLVLTAKHIICLTFCPKNI